MKSYRLEPTFVTYVPRVLEDGRLYVSMEYATAVHLCACGCGTKTVTPLSRGGWTLTFNGALTLRPSVGNGQARCRSHYLVNGDKIHWLPPIGTAETRAAIARDHDVAASAHAVLARAGRWSRLKAAIRRVMKMGAHDG
jgi:Family of unknown function (DUF6527)